MSAAERYVQWSADASRARRRAARRAGPELVGVQPQPEPGRLSRLQDRSALVGVERPALAEGVDPPGVRRARGEHVAANQRDELVGSALVLRGHDVGAEERRLGGEVAGDPEQPGLVGDGAAVAGLDLNRRDAGPIEPRRAGCGRARRARRRPPGRVAAMVTLIPPASYGAPAIRAANSAARSPANTRWVWLSTNPGITHRPPASIRWSAAGAGPVPTAATRSPSITTWASVSSPSSVLVTSSPMPSTATVLTTAPPQLAGDVDRHVTPVGDHHLPADDDVAHVGGGGREHAASMASSDRVPASRTESRPIVVRSASAPASIRPASGQPRAACRARPPCATAPERRGCPARPRSGARRARPPWPPRAGR